MKLSKRERTLVALALAMAVLFIYCKLYLYPYLDEYALLRDSMNEARIELELLTADRSREGRLLSEIVGLNKKRQELAVALPSQAELPGVIEHLEYLSREAGVELWEIAFDNPAQDERKQGYYEGDAIPGECTEIRMRMRIAGGYDDLISLIKGLEDSRRLFVVNGISVLKGYGRKRDYMEAQLDVAAFSMEDH